ncbi:MAG: hypothetical protein P8Y45_17005 [Exilibacterium sp.]
MAIVALSKVSLCGLLKEKTDILDALQRLGCLHLQPLRPPPAEPETVPPEHAENVHKALRFLLDTPLKRRQVTAAMLDQPAQFDLPGVVSETLKVQQREREISDRRDFLAQRIKQLQPWGDFTLPPEDQLAGYKLWFYLVPLSQMRLMPRKNLVWQRKLNPPSTPCPSPASTPALFRSANCVAVYIGRKWNWKSCRPAARRLHAGYSY